MYQGTWRLDGEEQADNNLQINKEYNYKKYMKLIL